MDRVIIAWNFRNWITIVLMAAIGMALVGIVSSFVRGNLSSLGGSSPMADQTAAT